jgi:hypothetical protein
MYSSSHVSSFYSTSPLLLVGLVLCLLVSPIAAQLGNCGTCAQCGTACSQYCSNQKMQANFACQSNGFVGQYECQCVDESGAKLAIGAIIGIVVGCIVAGICACVACCYFCRRRQQAPPTTTIIANVPQQPHAIQMQAPQQSYPQQQMQQQSYWPQQTHMHPQYMQPQPTQTVSPEGVHMQTHSMQVQQYMPSSPSNAHGAPVIPPRPSMPAQ